MKLDRQSVPFTQVANAVLYRTDVSLKAKGLFAYLFSKPDEWQFAADRIARECKEGRKGVQNTLNELEDADLLKRQRREDGRVDYIIKYSKSQNPQGALGDFDSKTQDIHSKKAGRTKVPAEHGAESVTISNKEEDSNKDSKKDIEMGSKVDHSLIEEVIKAFETVDPKNKNYYGNTTQRTAAAFLVREYGLETVLNRIAVLPRTNGISFFPTITSPVQLREKWVQLQSAVSRRTTPERGKDKRIWV